jgi:NAD(P)-dependent dehydrogenase (short-subunit alcohol dehydrogenase family)
MLTEYIANYFLPAFLPLVVQVPEYSPVLFLTLHSSGYLNFANIRLICSNKQPARHPNFVPSKNNYKMENKSKIALVTGGSRGLGRDMALRLAEKGIAVILTYNSRREEAQKVVAQIEQGGQKAAALQLNAGNVSSFDAFMEQVKEVLQHTFNTNRFDFLINNAGIGGHAMISDMSEKLFDELMNVHFKGVYFLTQKALPLLNDGGGIVNISSGLARVAFPGASAYGALKSAVEVFTRYLAAELGARRIKANVVAPGAVATDFNGGRVRDNEELNKQVAAMTALGRAGLPEDIGGVVAFLCTEDARWVNAQRIEVSGGMRL